jgi:hypothetical protein
VGHSFLVGQIRDFWWSRTGVDARAYIGLLVPQSFHGLDSRSAVGRDDACE